jgi:PKD repeat protein
MKRLWILAALLSVPAAALAQQAGIDCDCTRTGAYLNPAPGKNLDVSTEGLSPSGVYRVTTGTMTPAGLVDITVTRVSTGATVLTAQATKWGFSPDDDRFVFHYLTSGVHNVFLYDLSTSPARKVRELAVATGSARIQFSPTGRYFFYSWLTNPTFANLLIFDAVSGTTRHESSFAFTSAPGTGQDAFGTARWGFGPDANDRSFVYAYITGSNSATWVLVNLDRALQVRGETIIVISAFWQFSPCGDVIVRLTQPNTSQGIVELFRTRDGSPVPVQNQTFPVTTITFRSTLASHIATAGGTDYLLASNTADDSCGPPNTPPTAAFTVPTGTREGQPVSFTDSSTDPDGTVVGWLWDFGDFGSSADRNPTHTYLAAGSYSVTLRVTDNLGATGSVTHPITVAPDLPPVSSFTYTPPNPVARQVATFTDTSTDDVGIASRQWVIGDFFSNDAVVQVKLCSTVDATLSVYDTAFHFSSVTQTVTVSPPPTPTINVPAGGDLADAISLACPGDTIALAAGNYTGGVELRDIHMQGAGAGQSIVNGSGSAFNGFVLTAAPSSGFTIDIRDLTVAGGGSGGGGGGILVDGRGNARLAGIEARDNQGRGGVYIEFNANTVEVRHAYLHHNTNTVGGAGGGIGMFCCAIVTIADSEIAFNSAPDSDGGGAWPFEADQVIFTGNHVHDNSAGGSGGGLVVDSFGDGDLVMNNRFIRNTAASGAGFYYQGGANVLFAGNLVARNSGGGILDGSFSPALTIVNSTIADNTGAGLAFEHTTSPTEAYNTIFSGNSTDIDGTLGVSTNNLIGTDPKFAGPGDYHLGGNSPAIDAGDNAAVPTGLTQDIDGDPRVLDGNGDGTATVDIGYDELVLGLLRFTDSQTLSWTGATGSVTFNLYRGTFDNPPWVYDHVCLRSGITGLSTTDPSLPAARTGLYYLLSSVGAAGESSLGTDSANRPRPNSAPCP